MTPEHLRSLTAAEAAEAVRRLLLTSDVDLRTLAASLPPPVLPHLDDPEAACSLVEEAILLGADLKAVPELQGEERLGWRLASDGRLVPVHALAWRTGSPACPWDTQVHSANDWLRSPNRILGLSPQLLPFISSVHPTRTTALPLDRRLQPIAEAMRKGAASAASKRDDLEALLKLADQPPDPEERLHAVLVTHGDDRAPALAQVASQSLFFGADAELWAKRLELLLPSGRSVRWALRADDQRPRLLHLHLARMLKEAAPDGSLIEPAERWLRDLAQRLGDPAAQAAREALADHRRAWFVQLPPQARQETLDALCDLSQPLKALAWVLRGAAEGLTAVEQHSAAAAWRLRLHEQEATPFQALLGALALPALHAAERRQLARQAKASPDAWRVGVIVTAIQAAARAQDSELREDLAEELERYARGGKLAVAATVGLLQLIRQGAMQPKDAWVQRVRAGVSGPTATDPRVLREFDLVS